MPDQTLASGDSPELEALFDSISHQSEPDAVAQPDAAVAAPVVDTPATDVPVAQAAELTDADREAMYLQIGHLTRKLHDALHSLGLDSSLDRIMQSIPEARDRLNYMATLTENAAERVLNATDTAGPIQDGLGDKAGGLAARWDAMFANQLSVDEFKHLAEETRDYLHIAPEQIQATNGQLMEIIVAQDFQDLTGQVIKKMNGLMHEIQHDLLSLLIDFSPSEKRVELEQEVSEATSAAPVEAEQTMADQQQVDDLLARLGF